MKFGIGKPTYRSPLSKMKSKAKRQAKKAIIPGYGQKGTGVLKNPKKAVYNKVYNKTSFSLKDIFK